VEHNAVIAVDVVLTADDFAVANRAITSHHRNSSLGWFWIQLRGIVAIGLVMLATSEPFAWLLVAAEATAVGIEVRWSRARRKGAPVSRVLDGHYDLRENGLRRVGSTGEAIVFWSEIEQVTATSEHLLVRFGGTAWIFPFRCFESIEARDEFTQTLAARVSVTQEAERASRLD
jgi:hypothetical protein